MKLYKCLLGIATVALFLGCSDTDTSPNETTSSGPENAESESTSQDETPSLDEVEKEVGEGRRGDAEICLQ